MNDFISIYLKVYFGFCTFLTLLIILAFSIGAINIKDYKFKFWHLLALCLYITSIYYANS